MLTANNVAEYFLNQCDPDDDEGISNLKLQKLVYYAQGYHLAIFGKPFFKDKIEAWRHGPVIPNLYHIYKKYDSCKIPLPIDFDASIFSEEQIELLDEIVEVYGQFSAWHLRNMTHEQKPWIDHEADASVIPENEMIDFFKKQLN